MLFLRWIGYTPLCIYLSTESSLITHPPPNILIELLHPMNVIIETLHDLTLKHDATEHLLFNGGLWLGTSTINRLVGGAITF